MPEIETQYRVSWDMLSPAFADAYQQEKGENVWPTLSPEVWEGLPWSRTQRLSTDPSTPSQATQLINWATSHAQPIRDVVIETRHRRDTPWTVVEKS